MTDDMKRPPIIVHREPEGETIEFPRLNTVRQLLNRLGEDQTSVLVARGRELLTQDRALEPGDELLVRSVRSRG